MDLLPARRTRYHHGNLRNALVEASLAAARTGGPDAVVLRDMARQLGVSHNAGSRHFARRADLMAAVADRGLAELAAAIEVSLSEVTPGPDPEAAARTRLRAIGRAYFHFALAEPGLFRTIWAAGHDPAAEPGPAARGPGGLGPYQILTNAFDDLVEVGVVPEMRRPYSEVAAWSAVHGLANLVIDGPLRYLPAAGVEAALTRLCDVIDAGL
ncbi:MAG: TetR/AcrR family transcriptional regulator [Acidimicrobiales bacterium]